MKTLLCTLLFLLPFLLIGQSTCANVDFEDGNLDGWSTHGMAELVTRNELDGYGGFNLAASGFYSIKLGNEIYATESGASRTFLVTPDTRYFVYSFASVMEGAHGPDEAANFRIQVTDVNDSVIPCTSFIAYAIPGDTSEYVESTVQGGVYFKNWESNVMDLSNYVGQTLTLTLTCRWCVYDVHWSYAYIDSYCASQLIYSHKTCDNQSFMISTIPGFDQYNWSGPGVVSGQGTSTIEIDQPGMYTVGIPNQKVGCDSLHLEITADMNDSVVKPVVQFELTSSCTSQEAVFENGTSTSIPLNSCSWYLNDSLQNASWDFVYTPQTSDSIHVMLICENQFGCKDSLDSWYTPHTSYMGEIPNVFTPNGDSVNDFFDLPMVNITDYHLIIKNRWGILMFESFNENENWDGKANGELVEEGVYFYQLIYTCNEQRMKSGFVQVIR